MRDLNPTNQPELIFFLGAGASVAAGVPDTFSLVSKFLDDLEIRNKLSELRVCREIIKGLKNGGFASEEKVDVELLLEALDQLENSESCIPLKFFEVSQPLLGSNVENEVGTLKAELKNFIKKTGLVSKERIEYLEGLKLFMDGETIGKPLDIFSVNYDICIEQFCELFEKDYLDGFYLSWEPKSLEREDVDIRLYKIHGSIIWYRTDKGSDVKVPIRSQEAGLELITGEKATTSILYPMRKLEYTEPFIDLLMMLKERLSRARFVFVVGYSFRDRQIRRIFWNAAKRNRNLIVILISPNSREVYEERLRTFDNGVPSSLEGKVICLPYKFERVLPILKVDYFEELRKGIACQRGCQLNESQGDRNVQWQTCLEPFVNCEYVNKIWEVVEKGGWHQFRQTQPPEPEMTIAFKAFLTALLQTDEDYKDFWMLAFLLSFRQIFNAENLRFSIRNTESGYVIHASFNLEDKGYRYDLSRCLTMVSSLYQTCVSKASIVGEEYHKKLREIEAAIGKFQSYFVQFEEGMPISVFAKRWEGRHPDLEKQIYSKDKTGTVVLGTLTHEILAEIEREKIEHMLSEFDHCLHIACKPSRKEQTSKSETKNPTLSA